MPSEQNILFIGSRSGTSGQRAEAFRRLGHEVTQISPYDVLSRYWRFWLARTGGTGVDARVAGWISAHLKATCFDVAFVDSGEVLGPESLALIKRHASFVINYNADNPYLDPPPERNRWSLLRSALGMYDLCVSFDRPNQIRNMRRLGVKHPMVTWLCADEVAHARPKTIPQSARSRVVFAGTWMPGRGRFMADLLELGVPLTIRGPRWSKAPEVDSLRPVLFDEYLDDTSYGEVIAGADIALVILNPANNDQHTSRSAEIPAIGTAMVAPSTSVHERMYRDGADAVFYRSVEGCAAACHRLLSDPQLRARLAASGQTRVRSNKMMNEPLLSGILEAAETLRAEGKRHVAN